MILTQRRGKASAFVLALLAFCTLASACAAADLQSVRIRLKGNDLKQSALFDGREAYVPVDALISLGLRPTLTRREETAILQLPGGRTREVAMARLKGEAMAPVSLVAAAMGEEWRVEDGICEIGRKPTTAPKRKDPDPAAPKPAEAVTVQAPQKVEPADKPKVQEAQKPDPTVPAQPKQITPQGPLLTRVQPAERIEPNLLADPLFLAQLLPGRGAVQQPEPIEVAKPSVLDVSLDAMDDTHARLRIATSGKMGASVNLLLDPTRLAIDLANCQEPSEAQSWALQHPFLTGARLERGEKPGSVRLTVPLERLVSYRIAENGPGGVAINLSLPRGAGRRMKDLIIVVDPGHGGPATGCHSRVNGAPLVEKNLTLDMGLRLRAMLEAAGAKVVMTRTEDVDVSLSARPALATAANADLFVSIHVDDCGIPNSASGSTTYYHKQDESSRALAQSIIGRIRGASGLPIRGAVSDRVLYQTGLAVLRRSTVPAVLVETAFINNSRDRAKLVNPAFRTAMAQAIMDGIRGYLGAALPEDQLDSSAPISPATDGR